MSTVAMFQDHAVRVMMNYGTWGSGSTVVQNAKLAAGCCGGVQCAPMGFPYRFSEHHNEVGQTIETRHQIQLGSPDPCET